VLCLQVSAGFHREEPNRPRSAFGWFVTREGSVAVSMLLKTQSLWRPWPAHDVHVVDLGHRLQSGGIRPPQHLSAFLREPSKQNLFLDLSGGEGWGP